MWMGYFIVFWDIEFDRESYSQYSEDNKLGY